ncbi:MAG: hypothetical protein IT495_02155 [Gammaproteobacteria bacterium]|nr:hypothetical protein [Gammaproteobacteria bacterium]
MSCPRCNVAGGECRVMHEGREDGAIVWTVFHCDRCAFTWRDCEPAVSASWSARPVWTRVNPDEPERYPVNLPPAKQS